MIRTKYEVKRSIENVSVEANAEFEDDITYKFSNYNEMYGYFSRYTFTDFWTDFYEYDCKLRCRSKYYLQILSNNGCLFFGNFLVSTMNINEREEEPILSAIQSFDGSVRPIEEIDKILQDPMSYENVKVLIVMEIKYYLSQSLDPNSSIYEIPEEIMGRPLTDYEREIIDGRYDEGVEMESSVEIPFDTDECCICLTEKPDIILFPCLHKTVCLKCEERGELTKCPTCRLEINRKIKI